MHEKELREQFIEQCEADWNVGDIADWFIARIRERDERLKEAVRGLTPFGIGIPQDPLVSREAIINLFDNHA